MHFGFVWWLVGWGSGLLTVLLLRVSWIEVIIERGCVLLIEEREVGGFILESSNFKLCFSRTRVSYQMFPPMLEHLRSDLKKNISWRFLLSLYQAIYIFNFTVYIMSTLDLNKCYWFQDRGAVNEVSG